MDLSDIILTLVGLLTVGMGTVVKSIMVDVKDLENTMNQCQSSMPKDYVLKDDHKSDIAEIKILIADQSKKIDQIWKSLRVDK
jgi:hypothetical protein